MKVTRRRATLAGSLVALASLYALVYFAPVVRLADEMAYLGRSDGGAFLLGAERVALQTISVPSLTLFLVVLGWTAWHRSNATQAMRVVGSVFLAAVSAELLKAGLPSMARSASRAGVEASGSFPSGHTAIAASLALGAAAVVGPRVGRFLVGPMVAWVTIVAVATVAVGWHRPSDAVGGMLLALCWHAALVRSPTDAAPRLTSPWTAPKVRFPRRAATTWWVAASAVLAVGALATPARVETGPAETSGALYLLGLGCVAVASAVTLLPQTHPRDG